MYQIYPRSFADANGDGIGDLAGMTTRLDYLEWLGITGIWLNPINPSPNVHWGYDVADYTDVHPDPGSLADVVLLVAEAGRRGIRVLHRPRPEPHVRPASLVPGAARLLRLGERGAQQLAGDLRRRFRLGARRGSRELLPPQLREGAAGPRLVEPARSGREFQRILRFWFDRGIAGFRIDVAHGLVKDRELRDDVGSERVHSMNRPETHEVYREWRRLADAYEPPRVLLGEVYVLDVPAWAAYYGSGSDELNLAFNFALVHSGLDADEMRGVVADTEAALPPDAWPCWIGSNHDVGRLTTRWCGDDDALARCALLMLLTLRGTPSLYYGDSSPFPTATCRRSARSTSGSRHAIPAGRRCPGLARAAGRIRGCRSRTRAATSRTSAPTRAPP